MAIETGNPGPRLPSGSTPIKSRPGRPLSMDIPSNLHKKRKASQMEDSGDTYKATKIRSSIKYEPGLSSDDSPRSSRSTSPSASPTTRNFMGKVMRGHSGVNGKDGPTIFGPPPRIHDSPRLFKREADWPGDSREKASDVESRRSPAILSDRSMWDVSESEMHTTDIEESSDGGSVGSTFSPSMDRQESVKSEELSEGSDDIRQGESNHVSSKKDAVQDQNHISCEEPTEPATNGHDRMEQTTRQENRPTHKSYDRLRDESNAIPSNGASRTNNETTVHGKHRLRAAPNSVLRARDISRSWKTATPADKMLVKMKQKGCTWLEIRKAWHELTGEWPATSTLPNRYNRVKDHLMRLKSGDGKRLLEAVAEVEAQYQRSKWGMIVEAMERAGAAKYSKAFIQRKYHDLAQNDRLTGAGGALTEDESQNGSESDSNNVRGDRIASLRQRGAGPTVVENPSQESTRTGTSTGEAPP